ncbi:MAG: type III secretion system export apparatus subunit SctU [Lysobacteraceae bacterium]
MSKNEKGADQTELPTPHRLKEARKEGNVAKSRDLTSTVLLVAWFAAAWLLLGASVDRLAAFFDRGFELMHQPFRPALIEMGALAGQTFLWLTVPLLVMAVALGLLIEFLQVGPVLAFKKIKPKLEHLNPVEGVKRMFSMDNVVELVKSILKATAIVAVFVLVLLWMLGDILDIARGPAQAMGTAFWWGLVWITAWVLFVFFFVSALDAAYQRFSHTKKLKMSRRDIRQEVKDQEGDPLIKNQRRQLHQEWADSNTRHAVRNASVVVTNPTHIAVALFYEEGSTDLPVVVAKGEGHQAELIRQVAEEEGIPILQNIPLARGLNEDIEVDAYITGDFFEAVAEVLHWAQTVRDRRR